MLVATIGATAVDLCRALLSSGEMAWDSLWALAGGFLLSGLLRAVLPAGAIERHLGGQGPRSAGLAGLLGAVSSSCSYAASAMTRTLLGQGADLVTCTIFLLASTNLVIELGVVLVVLIGWKFVLVEVLGASVMIVLVFLFGRVALGGARVARAVEDVRADLARDARGLEPSTPSPRLVLALGYARADAWMLRRELVIGFLVAGLLGTLVPTAAFSEVFLHGHGWLTTLENVLVAPGVALVSFVCSIGNVPLAAALWRGGLGFSGTATFLFADLISLPVLLGYRRLFGQVIAMRLLLVLWPIMSAAGLLTGLGFSALGITPNPPRRPIAAGAVGLNATSALDLAAFVLIAGLTLLARRPSGSAGPPRDPVCGMPVDPALAGARTTYRAATYLFCSPGCRDQFLADPERFRTRTVRLGHPHARDTDPSPAAASSGRAPQAAVASDTASARRHELDHNEVQRGHQAKKEHRSR